MLIVNLKMFSMMNRVLQTMVTTGLLRLPPQRRRSTASREKAGPRAQPCTVTADDGAGGFRVLDIAVVEDPLRAVGLDDLARARPLPFIILQPEAPPSIIEGPPFIIELDPDQRRG